MSSSVESYLYQLEPQKEYLLPRFELSFHKMINSFYAYDLEIEKNKVQPKQTVSVDEVGITKIM
jgi:hypothetical protein